MMAEATLRNAPSLEYHNLLLLFTTPMDHVTTSEAQEYLRLLREEELDKLRRRRADSATNELREQKEREGVDVAEAIQERNAAAVAAREHEETLRQIHEAQNEIGDAYNNEDCDLGIDGNDEENDAVDLDQHVVLVMDSDDDDCEN